MQLHEAEAEEAKYQQLAEELKDLVCVGVVCVRARAFGAC